jgi:hypothetical protein
MNFSPNAEISEHPKISESDDALVARADERLAHAYEQIARADEQLARVTEQLSKLERDAARQPAAAPGRRRSRGRPVLRGLVGLLIAACILAVAFVSQLSHGDAVKLTVARWAPQLGLPPSLLKDVGLSTQPGAPVQVATAEPAALQSMPSAQTVPQTPAAPAAPPAPDIAQLLQTMARDLANVEEGIEQLKAKQEQMASDNAKLVEQLKANQEQMARLVAATPAPTPPPRASALPVPTPTAVAARRPAPLPVPPPQVRARPRAPMQLQPDDQ